MSRGLEALEHGAAVATATNRLTPILIIIASLLVFSVFTPQGSSMLYISMALLSMVVILRGYTAIATAILLNKCRTDVRVSGGSSDKALEYVVEISNRSFIPIALVEFTLNHPPYLRVVEGCKAGIFFIPPRSSTVYRVVFDPRTGRHSIGPLEVVVRDPLGLFRSTKLQLVKPVEVDVLPKVVEAVARKVWVLTRSTGVVRTREPGIGVELFGVREYRPGDELRRIVWRTLASAGRLSVKEMERETYQSIVFVIEASPDMFYGPYRATPFEHAATIIASITSYLARRGDLVSTVIVSPLATLTSGKPSRGKQAHHRILKTISMVPFATEREFDRKLLLQRALNKLVEILPRERNLVFLFTTASGDEIYVQSLAEFAIKLRSLGNEVYVAVPLTIAYEVRGLAPWAQAMYRVKMFDRLRYEIEFARRLARNQVKVIAMGPQYMPQTIVNLIEMKRSR